MTNILYNLSKELYSFGNKSIFLYASGQEMK